MAQPIDPDSKCADAIHRALALLGREVSHDISNITSTLRGALFLASEAEGGGELFQMLTRDVELACDRLEVLGDQLLLADTGGIDALARCDLAAEARAAADLAARVHDCAFESHLPPGEIPCRMSGTLLRAALAKTLEVLARASERDAVVTVRCEMQEGFVRLIVHSSHFRPNALRVEDPLLKLNQPEDPMGRMRVGLWHVQRCAAANGGDLWLRERGGTAVEILLPGA